MSDYRVFVEVSAGESNSGLLARAVFHDIPGDRLTHYLERGVRGVTATLGLTPEPEAVHLSPNGRLVPMIGERCNPGDSPSVFHLPGGRTTHEFTDQQFFDVVRVSHPQPGAGLVDLALPQPVLTEAGDTLHVWASADGRVTLVQHNTEGSLARLMATALCASTSTPNSDLLDRANFASKVLFEVHTFARRKGYAISENQPLEDMQRMLDELAAPSVPLRSIVKWAGATDDNATVTDVQNWVVNAHAAFETIDEWLANFGLLPKTFGQWSMYDRMAQLEKLIERVPPTGQRSLDGETWNGAANSQLVLEPSEDGDETALVSVYHDGDGPSVELDAAQLRDVATRFLARAAVLEANKNWWKDPHHPEVKGSVSWPEVYDPELSHASVNCCGRIECIEAAATWVEQVTGHRGEWTVYAEKGQ